jgi:membrane protein
LVLASSLDFLQKNPRALRRYRFAGRWRHEAVYAVRPRRSDGFRHRIILEEKAKNSYSIIASSQVQKRRKCELSKRKGGKGMTQLLAVLVARLIDPMMLIAFVSGIIHYKSIKKTVFIGACIGLLLTALSHGIAINLQSRFIMMNYPAGILDGAFLAWFAGMIRRIVKKDGGQKETIKNIDILKNLVYKSQRFGVVLSLVGVAFIGIAFYISSGWSHPVYRLDYHYHGHIFWIGAIFLIFGTACVSGLIQKIISWINAGK